MMIHPQRRFGKGKASILHSTDGYSQVHVVSHGHFGQIAVQQVSGQGLYEGQNYRIDFQNENIASYRNGQLDVTVPDLICMIGSDGEPMTIPDFGIDSDYVPFNKR